MAESAVQQPFWIPTKLRTVGARTATVLLTAVLLVALLSVSALLVWQSYRDTIRSAEAKAASSAQIVAAHTGWIGQAAFQALRRVDSALGPRPDVLMTGTIDDLDEAVATLPWGIYVWVFDADGSARRSWLSRPACSPSSGRPSILARPPPWACSGRTAGWSPGIRSPRKLSI